MKFFPLGRQILLVTFVEGEGHKAFDCKNRRQSDFCHNIRTYSKGQTYFFALGYDIVSDKTNLLVDCEATNHVSQNLSILIKILNQGTILLNWLMAAEQIT